ncbi:MAG: ABC transporter permease subunit [Nocardioidaceae bacterium]|nr:ABC transporter permease subunit [Nocardioidaceae bacterium]
MTVRHRSEPRALVLWRGLVGAAAVAALYQVVALAGIVDRRLLPAVPAIGREVARLAVDPDFLGAVGNTMTAVALGLLISCVAGIGGGLGLGASSLATRMTRAPIDVLRSLPSVALIPLLLMTLGDGVRMKTVVVVVVAVWPVLLNTTYGVRSVDGVAVDAARSFGLSRLRVWAGVVVPSAVPAALTGFRIALPMALTVAISSEMAAGTPSGIGGFILRTSYRDFDAAPVFAAVVLAGLIGWALNAAAAGLGNRLVPWEGRR